MKTKNLFWGFLFLTLGTLYLIDNFSSINFYWLDIWQFWPLFLILIGISLLIKQEIIRAILISFTAIILGAAIFSTIKSGWGFIKDEVIVDFRNGIHIKDIGDEKLNTKIFEEDFNENIKYASLNFKGGGGVFKVDDTTGNLFSSVTKAYDNEYSLIRYDEEENVKLNFTVENKGILIFRGKNNNRVHISLNSKPIWKLNFDIGAAKTELDLSDYKVEDLDVDIGAASVKIILGDLLDSSRVNIDAGASSLEIIIPENVGCELNADIILSSKKLDGFKKINDDIYRTENFNTSTKKIYMNIDSGVSSVKIERQPVKTEI